MTFENDIAIIQQKMQSGQYKHVLRVAKSAMKKNPRSPHAPNFAGIALGGMGQHRDAVGYFRKALKLDPGFQDGRKNLAQSLIMLGECAKAVHLMEIVLAHTPKDADAWYLLAQAHLTGGDNDQAEQAVNQAIAYAPGQPRSFSLRALARKNLGQDQAAIADYREISRLTPSDPGPHLEVAVLLIRQMQMKEAHDELVLAQQLAPDDAQVFNLMGMLAAMQGNADEAIANYRRVVELDPGYGEAFLQLALFQDQAANAEMEPALQSAIDAAERRSHSLALLHFARANIHRQAGETLAEAAALKQANRIEAALRPCDHDREDRLLTAMIMRPHAASSAVPVAPIPVFIIGLPRSGTSLVEQVVTASVQVFGCGELPMGATLTEPGNSGAGDGDADPIKPEDFADYYRSRLPELPAETTHFVDKLPGNYKVVGPLLESFPNARFIHLRRDPRDTALSMWRAYFAEGGLNFAFDQRAMAREINRYAQVMQHWTATCPEAILNLEYEDIVKDLPGTSHAIAEFCGFDWTPGMVTPERNSAPVRTASASQVRQGVHRRSVGGWRNMAPALVTFTDALDIALWPGLSD